MSIEKDTFTFHNFKSGNLGLKIILAADTKRNEIFAIISDVNPAGCCYIENIAPGDVLFSINGIEINSFDNLNNATKLVFSEKTSSVKITILRKRILDGSDLIKRCIDSPCSDLCEFWTEKNLKVKKRIETVDRKKEMHPYTLKPTRVCETEENPRKLSSAASVDEPVISGKFLTPNNPKIIYHQRALPLVKNTKSSKLKMATSTNVVYKPTRTSNLNLIAPPQPQFIKRPNARMYNEVGTSNLKPARSLNDISTIHISQSVETSSTSSSSTNSSQEHRFFPTTKTDNPIKPKPMPRTKFIPLSREESFEPHQFISLTSSNIDSKTYSNERYRKPPMMSNEVSLKIKEDARRIRQKQFQNQRSIDHHLNGGSDL